VEGFLELMALDHDPGPVNLGNPRESTIEELAQLVIRLTGSRSELCRLPLPVDDPTRRCPDIAKAKKLLGWEPTVPLEQGLAATITYMRDVVLAEHAADQAADRAAAPAAAAAAARAAARAPGRAAGS
jgi:UDP-glucuronate decarboxylase